VTAIDDLLQHAERYAGSFAHGDLPIPPARRLAIVACMDARLNLYALLGLREGDAHIIRNAGGVVTDDVIRSLTISQRLLGTEEVMLVHHTDCGLAAQTEDGFRRRLEEETGLRPTWALEAFEDVEASVRQSIERIRRSPFVARAHGVRGFVYEVETGRLREVA
jgi:carbonic anhydrase